MKTSVGVVSRNNSQFPSQYSDDINRSKVISYPRDSHFTCVEAAADIAMKQFCAYILSTEECPEQLSRYHLWIDSSRLLSPVATYGEGKQQLYPQRALLCQ